MRSIRNSSRASAAKPLAVAIVSALQWSIRLFRVRSPLQIKFRSRPRHAPLLNLQYIPYVMAIETSHCTNCSYGDGLLSCYDETGLATNPSWCPLMWTPAEVLRRLPFALVRERVGVEHKHPGQDAHGQVERPTRDSRARPATDVMSHLGP